MSAKFKNWLLVSDIDGTLNNKFFKLPKKNKDAIESYVSNGGVFTLCSGRNLQSLAIHYEKLGIETPAIFLNGAGIYDFSDKKIIDYNPISNKGEEVILELFTRFKTVQLTVYGPDKIYLATKGCWYGYIISKLDNLDYKLCKKTSDLPSGNWGKISFFGTKKLVNKIRMIIENEYGDLLDCFFTSPFTLEVVNKGVNKGMAVLKLANLINIDIKNTAAIGDYYNDVDMLKAVSHPACCGQAPEDIKELAEYVTCHCNDGAVADFIDYIGKNYI